MVKLAGGHPSRPGAMIRLAEGGTGSPPAQFIRSLGNYRAPNKIPLAEDEVGSFAGREPVAGSHVAERKD
jgi:hypothetical protein